MIASFTNEYRFLSNFYAKEIFYHGRKFQSSESAYQAEKCENESEKDQFCLLSAGQAKRLGRKVKMRKDWDEIKIRTMKEILEIKFSQSDLKNKLLETKGQELVEGNTWHDTFWGVCEGVGENNLGKLLMQIRSSLRSVEQGRTC